MNQDARSPGKLLIRTGRAARIAALALALGGVAAFNPAGAKMQSQSDNDVRTAILAVNARFADAMWRKDKAQLATIYTEDTILLPAGRPAITGRDHVLGFWEAAFGPEGTNLKSKLEPFDITVLGDYAYEAGRATVIVVKGGHEQVIDNGKYMVIWKREDDGWKMHRDIFNSDAPAQPRP